MAYSFGCQASESRLWGVVFICNAAKFVLWTVLTYTGRIFLPVAQEAYWGLGRFIGEVSRSLTTTHTTLHSTPVNDWSARCRDFYLKTYNTQKRHTSMPLAGFEPAVPASERPQAYALGYGYNGARTDTTQQTNICLGIHRRHVWLHLIRHACPYVLSIATTFNPMRTTAGIWPDWRL